MTFDVDATCSARTLSSTETMQLAEIRCLDTFYTPIEERYERLTRIARSALRTQVTAVTSISADSQWFKSVRGWNVIELPIERSLCAATIEKRRTVVVQDLARHPRYSTHPLVLGAPRFCFYAGVPLHNARGSVIGTFCALSAKPMQVSKKWLRTLEDIAELAERELLTVAVRDTQSELIAKLSYSRRQALLDPLTRVWNREGGMVLLADGIETAKRDTAGLAIVAVDIDKFKSINHNFGHAAGDRALRMVARELLASVNANGGVCRLGGDGFFAMLIGASKTQAEKLAERVRQAIHSTRIRTGKGGSMRVSVAAGVCYFETGQLTSAEEMLADANLSLAGAESADAGSPGQTTA